MLIDKFKDFYIGFAKKGSLDKIEKNFVTCESFVGYEKSIVLNEKNLICYQVYNQNVVISFAIIPESLYTLFDYIKKKEYIYDDYTKTKEIIEHEWPSLYRALKNADDENITEPCLLKTSMFFNSEKWVVMTIRPYIKDEFFVVASFLSEDELSALSTDNIAINLVLYTGGIILEIAEGHLHVGDLEDFKFFSHLTNACGNLLMS